MSYVHWLKTYTLNLSLTYLVTVFKNYDQNSASLYTYLYKQTIAPSDG